VRPVLRGGLGRILGAVSLFELANVAATLLILRATELLEPGRGHDRAVQIALVLYIAYNAAATLASIPAGRIGDRQGQTRVLAGGIAAFAASYALFAATTASVALLAVAFLLAGLGIGCVETAEHAAVATHSPVELRGSAFGLLAAIQSVGNLCASTVAGLIWTIWTPAAAFSVVAALSFAALIAMLLTPGPSRANA
jgi:MFS family permease